ncbi:MAG: hypothetical protein KatS3mg113_0520 [Planctomycetaceae bacterium]|nr:MAG: hypothetical protein KatS3mg113_0520 [Planctomycetaceae bacterium]
MPREGDDEARRRLAQSYHWATMATTIALQAVVPIAVGWWVDRRWGSDPWGIVIGAGLGLLLLLLELSRWNKPRHQSKL